MRAAGPAGAGLIPRTLRLKVRKGDYVARVPLPQPKTLQLLHSVQDKPAVSLDVRDDKPMA